jgi:hypothetical protein
MHRGLLIATTLIIAALLAADGWVLARRSRYRAEIDRLRASMTVIERQRADEIVANENNKLRLAVELIRRQARLERDLHLAIAIDSGTMYMERDGALLRQMPVQVARERRVGVPPDTVHLAPPRGVRTVARVLTEEDAWEVPAWVFADRRLTVPSERRIVGALGYALVLDGGSVVYALPKSGPLADSTYLLAGAVRARSEDLRAILPNLRAGTRVYFY